MRDLAVRLLIIASITLFLLTCVVINHAKAQNNLSTTKVVVQTDILFAFNESKLTARGKLELDKIATLIKESTTIKIVGHSDELGSIKYNLKLSEQRAKSVVDYLSTKTKANYLHLGVGSYLPAKGTENCKNIKSWIEKSRCYAPNRRVEIEYISN